MTPRAWILLLLALAAAAALAPRSASAEGPPGETGQVVLLEGLPPPGPAAGQESIVLSARVSDAQGQPLGGLPVTFYVVTDVFGERLMKVGEVLTDAGGVASLPYRPTWTGDHTVVLRFPGSEAYAAVQDKFQFQYSGPVRLHEDAPFGLEPVRSWLPVVIGAIVLAVWALLGLVVVRTVAGIPAAATPMDERSAVLVPGAHPRHASLGRALALVAAVLLLGLPAAWFLLGQRGQDVVLLTEGGRLTESRDGPPASATAMGDVARPPDEPLKATLVRFVTLVSQDAAGQPALGSADLPADVALLDGRIFVLDSNRSRVLAVTRDDEAASLFEGQRGSEVWFGGALAMDSHDDRLYIANAQAGNVVVIAPPGVVEGVIVPQAPPGAEPLKLAGIALTPQGDIWLSDAANHRVLQVNSKGELLATIGQGVASSGDYGFDTPGGLALDGLGNLHVVDTGNRLVKQYSPMGVFLADVGADRLVRPRAAAVGDEGTVFVSDEGLASVLAFGPQGTYLGSLDAQDPARQDSKSWFLDPLGLEVDGNDLYVMDRLAGLLVFDLGGAGLRP